MAIKRKDETPQDEIEAVEAVEAVETVEAVEEVEEAEGTVETEEADSSSLDDEAMQDIIEEVEEDHSVILASLGADLEFLHGDNMSFYQANKAYYEDQNYEEAISEFQAAIKYEKSHPPDPPDEEESEEFENIVELPPPNEIIAKSLYWMGEAYLKLDQIDQAVEIFGELSVHYDLHYLAPAAQRRITSLQPNEESESA